MLAGCLPPEPKHTGKKEKKPDNHGIVLNTGPGWSDVYSLGKARSKQWTVSWQRLGVGVTQAGAKAGTMLTVKGEVFSEKYPLSTVVADSGRGANENKMLELEGNVVVTSKDGKTTLKCDRLKYVAATHRYYASGNVRFKNPVASLGTFSQLVATADLKKVATPQDFSPDMQSNLHLAHLAGVDGPHSVANAPIELRTTDGQTVVTYRGIQFQQIDAKHSRYLLTGGVVALFKKTLVTITSDRATILAATDGKNTELTSINALGNVKLVKTDRRPTGSIISTLTSAQIDYLNGKTNSSATCKGHVLLTRADSSKHTTLHATGGSGNALFAGGAQSKNTRLAVATLRSPVDIQVNQAPLNGQKAVQAHITCSQMIYRPTETAGTLELTGAIKMVSNQGTLSNLSRATVHLNAKNEVQGFEGGPGN